MTKKKVKSVKEIEGAQAKLEAEKRALIDREEKKRRRAEEKERLDARAEVDELVAVYNQVATGQRERLVKLFGILHAQGKGDVRFSNGASWQNFWSIPRRLIEPRALGYVHAAIESLDF